MKRRLMAASVTATLLLLGCMQLMAHDDKIHKATVGEVAAATADGLDLKTKTGIVKVRYSSKTGQSECLPKRTPEVSGGSYGPSFQKCRTRDTAKACSRRR